MAVSKAELKSAISEILKGADWSSITAKKIRAQLEIKFKADLTSRKQEIDDLIMELTREKDSAADSDENDENGASYDSSDKSDGDDDYEPSSKKRSKAPSAKNKNKRAKAKKHSSDEDGGGETDEGDEDDSDNDKVNDEELARKIQKEELDGRKRAAKKPKSDEQKKETPGAAMAAAASSSGKKKKAGYTKECALTPTLAEVVGAPRMSRPEVVKKIWEIVKTRNLRDPKDGRYTICDEQLLSVFGVRRFQTFSMMKYLKNHIIPQ